MVVQKALESWPTKLSKMLATQFINSTDTIGKDAFSKCVKTGFRSQWVSVWAVAVEALVVDMVCVEGLVAVEDSAVVACTVEGLEVVVEGLEEVVAEVYMEEELVLAMPPNELMLNLTPSPTAQLATENAARPSTSAM